MRKYFNWLLGEPCDHDYYVADKYLDDYVEEGQFSYRTVVYVRYILKCKKCGKRKDTSSDFWEKQANKKAEEERSERLKEIAEHRKKFIKERLEQQGENRRRVGIGNDGKPIKKRKAGPKK